MIKSFTIWQVFDFTSDTFFFTSSCITVFQKPQVFSFKKSLRVVYFALRFLLIDNSEQREMNE